MPTFNRREVATLLAALRYWSEEVLPHGNPIMRPDYRAIGQPRIQPLTAAELNRLCRRLRGLLRKPPKR